MIKDRTTEVLTPIQTQPGWYLRNYLIRADAAESIDVEGYANRLHQLVGEIEQNQLSNEFEYFRVGFVVGHFGKRGVCVSIWHWGKWLTSHELFNQCWYTYGRDLRSLSLLDGKEPVFCQFEVPILIKEFSVFHQIAAEGGRAILFL